MNTRDSETYLITVDNLDSVIVETDGRVGESWSGASPVLVRSPVGVTAPHWSPGSELRWRIEEIAKQANVDARHIRVWRLTPMTVQEEVTITIDEEGLSK